MVVTLQQAGSLWCPMRSGNRNGITTDNCIGTECAAWRWYDTPMKVDDEGRPDAVVMTGAVKMVPRGEERRGFCGMAARPLVA